MGEESRMDSQKLTLQIAFLKEIDAMKTIYRQNWVVDKSRREDDASHSWHAAMMAMTLSEYAKPTVQIDRAIKMLLVHDLVEIYAGDTPCFDADAVATQDLREQAAVARVGALLPPEQAETYSALFAEFDAAQTDDAQYAAAIDRLQPLLLNYYTDGASWKGRTVTRGQVYARNALTKAVLPALWPFVEHAVEVCVQKGLLHEDDAV